jgi:CheY-like chemotaxis protein
MKLLIAEDESDIALTYKKGLEGRNYHVTITPNGEECLKVYNEELHRITFDIGGESGSSNSSSYKSLANNPPFDIVLLDYCMPEINGLDVAKEILSINSHQRIIFASAYVNDELKESAKCLEYAVEFLQKPFSINQLINILEDNKLYTELQKFNIDIDLVKAVNPTHEQIMELIEKVRLVEKEIAF